jgi:hypothetical protein
MHLTAVACAVLALPGLLAAADPAIGTWKLNVAKSKYTPGPAPKSGTVVYEARGAGIRRSGQTIGANGETSSWEYSANYDGKDYPLKGHPAADTIAVNRVDEYTTEATLKKNGQVVSTARRVVSKDGKTMTITSKGRNAQGQPAQTTAIYDRQP